MTEPPRARIVVLGAGAMGSWLGALLAHAGQDVTLVARPEHGSIVAARGLEVSGKTTLRAHPKVVLHARDADVPDVLILAVKAYDTAKAMGDAAPLVGAGTSLVTLQNGLGNVEAISERVDARQVFAAVTTHGVTFVEPGHVRHAGTGDLRIGSPAGDAARAETLAALLRTSGLAVETTPNVLGEIWAKVAVNAAINPLTAITGLPNGALLQVAALREVMQRAVEECADVARAERVTLPAGDLLERARRVAEQTASNKSSMLQDVERGRRTEIEAICGEIVRRGARHGIDAPVNLALRACVKGIEESTRR